MNFRDSRNGLVRGMAGAAVLMAVVFIGGCASSGDTDSSGSNTNKDLPAVDQDGLELVKGTRHSAAYVDPDADFSEYKRVTIAEVEVAFRKNWLRDQNRDQISLSGQVSQKDADKIKASVASEFTRVFTEELEKGGYEVVDYEGFENSAQDLLLLTPAIVNLDVAAPDVMSPGRSRSFSASAGSMTLYLEFHDSITGALLGRVMDAQNARDSGYMQVSNSVTNKADADRLFRKWAQILVAKLDKVHGK